MGWFDWFRRLVTRSAPLSGAQEPPSASPEPAAAPPQPPRLEPESDWQTGCDGDLLWMIDRDGRRHQLPLSQLHAVAIETNASGPQGMDFWWLIYGPEEDVAFTFPQGATGESTVLEHVTALPGFRHDAFQAAIQSTDEDTFVIWQRPFP